MPTTTFKRPATTQAIRGLHLEPNSIETVDHINVGSYITAESATINGDLQTNGITAESATVTGTVLAQELQSAGNIVTNGNINASFGNVLGKTFQATEGATIFGTLSAQSLTAETVSANVNLNVGGNIHLTGQIKHTADFPKITDLNDELYVETGTYRFESNASNAPNLSFFDEVEEKQHVSNYNVLVSIKYDTWSGFQKVLACDYDTPNEIVFEYHRTWRKWVTEYEFTAWKAVRYEGDITEPEGTITAHTIKADSIDCTGILTHRLSVKEYPTPPTDSPVKIILGTEFFDVFITNPGYNTTISSYNDDLHVVLPHLSTEQKLEWDRRPFRIIGERHPDDTLPNNNSTGNLHIVLSQHEDNTIKFSNPNVNRLTRMSSNREKGVTLMLYDNTWIQLSGTDMGNYYGPPNSFDVARVYDDYTQLYN